jgi:YbdK family carboxylate-amine ligase
MRKMGEADPVYLGETTMKRREKKALEFKQNVEALTLGVELELQVLDGESLLLTPRAAEVLERGENEKLQPEFFQSTLEVITSVCHNLHALESDLKHSLQLVSAKAHTLNLKIASTGTHPLADYRERLITPSKRYEELIDRNQWIIRRMAVYGMHVHIGMPSGDACIRYNYFFMHFLPHILALSASSPFWQGKYTGLSSCRPTTYEALPTAGMPYLVRNWNEFQKLYRFLVRTEAIESMKDLWWICGRARNMARSSCASATSRPPYMRPWPSPPSSNFWPTGFATTKKNGQNHLHTCSAGSSVKTNGAPSATASTPTWCLHAAEARNTCATTSRNGY